MEDQRRFVAEFIKKFNVVTEEISSYYDPIQLDNVQKVFIVREIK